MYTQLSSSRHSNVESNGHAAPGESPLIGWYGIGQGNSKKGSLARPDRVTERIDKTSVIWVEFNRYDPRVDPARDKNSSGGILMEEWICPTLLEGPVGSTQVILFQLIALRSVYPETPLTITPSPYHCLLNRESNSPGTRWHCS